MKIKMNVVMILTARGILEKTWTLKMWAKVLEKSWNLENLAKSPGISYHINISPNLVKK